MKKQIAIFFLLFTIVKGHSQKLNIEKWKEDIAYYQTELVKRHINPFHAISKSKFNSEIEDISRDISKKTELEIIIDLMRLTRQIGDGHTAISLGGIKRHIFPINVSLIEDEWRVIRTSKEYQSVLGKKLTHIGGKNIKEIAKEISEIAQYVENNHSLSVRTGQYMMLSELLYGLNLTSDLLNVNFTFEDDSLQKTTISIRALESNIYYEDTSFVNINVSTKGIEKPENAIHDFFWFTQVKNTKCIYIKFESYPSF